MASNSVPEHGSIVSLRLFAPDSGGARFFTIALPSARAPEVRLQFATAVKEAWTAAYTKLSGSMVKAAYPA